MARRPMFTRPRRALTLSLLIATGALTAVLGYEAWDASRSSVRLAEEKVRDQSLFAAANLAAEARGEVTFGLLEEGLDIIESSLGRRGNRPLTLDRLREAARARRWNAMDQASLFFRLDPREGEVSVADILRGPRAPPQAPHVMPTLHSGAAPLWRTPFRWDQPRR
ncbi:MAG: hypothetical protein OXI18_06115 [bacterium]|nr:hypothetical protein [bacterium]